jgi:splicing factor 3A subunit 3
VYKGRRDYEKHFMESRHVQGMRALGIPNTKLFFEIKSIEDAVKLWNNITKKSQNKGFDMPSKQELEDIEGNVYDKETFDLLLKQGVFK